MRVVLINYGYFLHHTTPEQLLDCFRTLPGWAQGLAGAGAEVAVVQGFDREHYLRRDGIDYYFVRGPFAPQMRRWWMPQRMHDQVRRLAPDVVHLNGLLYALQARALRWKLPETCALVVQHHAEGPGHGPIAFLQRWGLAAADGFFFTGQLTAQPWHEAGMIKPGQAVFEIVEGSSNFRPIDRGRSRAETGLRGQPVFLWVGNLDANKDPLTVLAGFEAALAEQPDARLYMAYRFAKLLPEVRARIAASQRLRGAVELLGEIPYADIERYYNSADFLLQGSHKEGSGYAVVDALACGVVPVVTDIPPFRFMTGDGAVGMLWAAGNAVALSRAILQTSRLPLEPQRQAAQFLFEQHLSYQVIGRKALEAYRLLQRHRPGQRA